MKNPVEQLRRYRELNRRGLKRGALPVDQQPTPQRPKQDDAWVIVVSLLAIGGIVGAGYGAICDRTAISAIENMLLWGLIAAGGYALLPLLVGIRLAIQQRGCPDADFLKKFRFGHTSFCLATLAILLAWLSLPITEIVWPLPDTSPPSATAPSDVALSTANNSVLFMLQTPQVHVPTIPWDRWQVIAKDGGIAWGGWLVILIGCFLRWKKTDRSTTRSQTLGSQSGDKNDFRLWLGQSTGTLAQLGHRTSLAAQQHVNLSLEDAAQNILILGGIGSGKTTRAMHPLLLQLLDQPCGGLIFDVKGDFHQAVRYFAHLTQRQIITIGPGHTPLNLLAGLTPEIAASFLKSVLLLAGQHRTDSFWVDSASELCRNILGLLAFLPEHYSLQGLYGYLFDPAFREEVAEALEIQRAGLSQTALRQLTVCEHYHTHVFDQFDEKVKSGVRATLSQVLSPFNHPELMDAFCTAQPQKTDAPTLSAVLTGSVFLVSLPLSTWGLGAKVVYTLIKLRFYNLMQQRTAQARGESLSPVFFLCDEFQEIVSANKDGLSDLNFWDKARSSKTIGIVSAQALSSFYANLGDRALADTLCQNFRQKLCFRSEDPTTLQYFQSLVDKVEVSRRTQGRSSGTQSASGMGSAQTSHSQSENTSWTEKSVLTAQGFRQLGPNEVVALLSIGGHSADDVLAVQPIYIPSTPIPVVTLTEED